MEDKIILNLFKDLFNLDNIHEEYSDENETYVIDAIKENEDKIIITLTHKKSDKEKFEQWVNKLDDEIFTDTWESLSNEYDLKTLNDIYETDRYPEIIKLFKKRAKEITEEKVRTLLNNINFG